jgi:hypothetical protein
MLATVVLIAAAAPAMAQADGPCSQPDENVTQACGPLAGGTTYVGTIQTSNDEDFFYFYTSGEVPFDLAATNTGPDSCFGPHVELRDSDGKLIAQIYDLQNPNDTRHIRYTAPDRARYFVHVYADNIGGCSGPNATYQFRIDPASSLTSLPPPPPTGTGTTPGPSGTTSPPPIQRHKPKRRPCKKRRHCRKRTRHRPKRHR